MITPLSDEIIITKVVEGDFSFLYPKVDTVKEHRRKINEIIAYLNLHLPDDNISSWETIAGEWKKIAQEALAELKVLKESK